MKAIKKTELKTIVTLLLAVTVMAQGTRVNAEQSLPNDPTPVTSQLSMSETEVEAFDNVETNASETTEVDTEPSNVLESCGNLCGGATYVMYDILQEAASSTCDDGAFVDFSVEVEESAITAVDYYMYTTVTLNVRAKDDEKAEKIGVLPTNTEVHVIGESADSSFVLIENVEGSNDPAYVHSDYLSTEKQEEAVIDYGTWNGESLTSYRGTVDGPSGKETYYNLDMSNCIGYLRDLGIEGSYWVRNDGAKMYGPYILVAANFDLHPRGSLVPTSLGTGIVCDTGSFIYDNPCQLDIATVWN